MRTLSRYKEGAAAAPSGPHVIATPLARPRNGAGRDWIVRTSAERYTQPRASVDAGIRRFLSGRDAA